jgi:hypothetical protein
MTSDMDPPGGVRPGQVSILLLGRVIIGDIAVTLVDLALRGLLTVEPTDGDDWLLTPEASAAAGTLDYERQLLAGLAHAGSPARLSSLAPGFGRHMDKARSQIIGSAAHHGWIHHLHHDQRTSKGTELGAQVRAFHRDLRRAMPERGRDVAAGPLLPYALRFGLVTDDETPLVRFAHACVRTLVAEPGWAPPQPARRPDDEVVITLHTSADTDRHNAAMMMLAFGVV